MRLAARNGLRFVVERIHRPLRGVATGALKPLDDCDERTGNEHQLEV